MASPEFIRLGSRRITRARFLVFERDYLLTDDGRWTVREVVRHPGSVVVIPWDGEAAFMIEQYRHPAGRQVLELPAGKLDIAGEPPEQTARRECIEEVGLSPASLTLIQGCFTSPGFTDEYSHIYLAEGLTRVALDPQGIEEERAVVIRLTPDEIRDGLRSLAFEDSTTLVGLFALLDHLDS